MEVLTLIFNGTILIASILTVICLGILLIRTAKELYHEEEWGAMLAVLLIVLAIIIFAREIFTSQLFWEVFL